MDNKYIETNLNYEEMPLLEYISAICKYAGSKKRLLYYIKHMANLCDTDTFIDLCGGSGIVSMNINAPHKIINDISVVHSIIYKVLSNMDMANDLRDMVNYALNQNEIAPCSECEVSQKALEDWLQEIGFIGPEYTTPIKLLKSSISQDEKIRFVSERGFADFSTFDNYNHTVYIPPSILCDAFEEEIY